MFGAPSTSQQPQAGGTSIFGAPLGGAQGTANQGGGLFGQQPQQQQSTLR